MDPNQFRQQIAQRYVAGKGLDGASADEIAKGLLDPVEQMNYICSSGAKSKRHAGSGNDGAGVIFLLLLALLFAVVSVLHLLLGL